MIRRQLTLFVPEPCASAIEMVRGVVDPIQRALISAHVTLCREDELGDLNSIRQRLHASPPPPVVLCFSAPQRYMEHGLLLECVDGLDAFRRLREQVLASDSIRNQTAHITLAHPRNPAAPGNSLQAAARLNSGLAITFDEISLIEQQWDRPWMVLERYPLAA
jgi:hypothetical protein